MSNSIALNNGRHVRSGSKGSQLKGIKSVINSFAMEHIYHTSQVSVLPHLVFVCSLKMSIILVLLSLILRYT